MAVELADDEFIATINEVNQVTVPKEIRDKFSIESKEKLVLAIKGKVSVTARRMKVKAKEVTKEDD